MNNQYLDVFLEEAREHIQSLNNDLLNLEKMPSHEIVDEIFRSAHTLKGMSGTMGFEGISEITHEMENLLQEIRNEQLQITPELIDTLLECVDILEEFIENIAEKGYENEKDIDHIIEKLRKKNFTTQKQDNNTNKKGLNNYNFNEYELRLIEEAQEKNMNTWEIIVNLDKDCLLKSARAFLVFKNLETLGEIIKTVPLVQDIEDEKFDTQFTIYIVTKSGEEELSKALSRVSELKSIEIKAVDGKKIDKISKGKHIKEKKGSRKPSADLKDSNHIKQRLSKTLRVDINRLDNLMNLVSELIIIKTRLEDLDESNDLQKRRETIEYLERITSNLHNAVMKVRMVPIENVFNRFPRVVHDLSRELSKNINLEIEGAETELDRTIIDEIGDPLIHLIRNAADHGIETPDARRKKGKDEEGTIKLKAYHDGNNVVIEVSDDGEGIDKEAVLEKALKANLIDVEQSEKLKENEVLSLMFEPGFSTKEQVTDVSGRGVGLDVVKTKIESLGGSIEVKMKKGIGTTFSIRLPLTLAIIQALMVIVGKEKFAIPLSAIKETVIISADEIKNVQKNEVVLLRGNVIPIIRLNKILDVSVESETARELILVIIKQGEKDVALAVDNLIGQQEIVIKSLGNYLKDIRFIAGATILGDGTVALILDTNTLI